MLEDYLEANDCYDLVKLFYKNNFNVELPNLIYKEVDCLKLLNDISLYNQFHLISEPKIGDLIAVKRNNEIIHLGVVYNNNTMLHKLNTIQLNSIEILARKFTLNFYRLN